MATVSERVVENNRVEQTVWAQAWHETLQRFPRLVISESLKLACDVRWLAMEGGQPRVDQIKVNQSQASSFRYGKKDANGRTIEGLLLALFQHDPNHEAFRFCVSRILVLLEQRGQDCLEGTISPDRQQVFRDLVNSKPPRAKKRAHVDPVATSLPVAPKVVKRENCLPSKITLQSLLEEEFIARGMDPTNPEDQQRFADASIVAEVPISVSVINAALSGQRISDTDLGRLRNMLYKDRLTGEKWSTEELVIFRNRTATLATR